MPAASCSCYHHLSAIQQLQQRTPDSPPQHSLTGNKDLDLINSKLDTIKALLTSLDQRLSHLERNTSGEQKGRLW